MNPESSRRSACDRCRGQKLRCVRPSKKTQSTEEQSLEPCERCRKARVDCVNTLPPSRKHMRPDRFSPRAELSLPSHDRILLHLLLSKNASTNQQVAGLDALTTSAESTVQQSLLSRAELTSIPQSTDGPQENFTEHHSRKCSTDSATAELSSPSFYQGNAAHYGSNSDSSSLPMELDTAPFNSEKNMASNNDTSSLTDNALFDLDANAHTHYGDTSAFMEMLCTPEPSHQIKPNGVNAEAVSTYTENERLLNLDSRERCLYRLSELSSQLLRDFSRTSSANLQEIISVVPYGFSGGSDSSGRIGSPETCKNAIGKVLEHSQSFLEILRYLRPSTPSYAGSECSYSDVWDEAQLVSEVDDRRNSIVTGLEMGDTLKNPSSTVDMATTLTILTCYTWLLQIYGNIFSRIHDSLRSQAALSQHSIFSVLPGVQFGGFNLDHHQDLQIEILLQLCSKMLERIEETLGINVITKPRDFGSKMPRTVLDVGSASALLDIIFKSRCLDHQEGSRWERAAGLKLTMERIREILKEGKC
ncbi:hypothetical protein F5X99DRAFT_368043 [Biscogniauxia marginata]|nr:hypothetical protein F5X99DRAFT_368043 [Biscogniauxia marginata]